MFSENTNQIYSGEFFCNFHLKITQKLLNDLLMQTTNFDWMISQKKVCFFFLISGLYDNSLMQIFHVLSVFDKRHKIVLKYKLVKILSDLKKKK